MGCHTFSKFVHFECCSVVMLECWSVRVLSVRVLSVRVLEYDWKSVRLEECEIGRV